MINIIFGMPGVNCAVVGCGSCRGTKGIGIFKLPSAKDDKHKRWRDEWVGELKKTREVDKDFRRKIGLTTEYRATFEGLSLLSGSSTRQSILKYIIQMARRLVN